MEFILNMYTNWYYLPWQKIYDKICLVQRQIYKYAQSCKIDMMHKYQQYLCNCHEIKILAIQHITDGIQQYYRKINNEIYFINDRDKFLLFKYLFTEYIVDDAITFILEQVKQHIVYLCIEPEWKSKNILSKICNKNLNKSNVTKNNQHDIYQRYIIGITIAENLTYNINIEYYFNDMLDSVDILQNIYNSNKLFKCILDISTSTTKWYRLYSNSKDLCPSCSSIQSDCINSDIIKYIKSVLSYTNNYLKKNINLNLYYLINRIVLYIENIYSHHIYFIKYLIIKMYKIINNILYYWCKKKYKKNIFNHYIYIHNKFLNYIFYSNKFKSLYSIYTRL